MINPKWQRMILLFILLFEAWGGITGGTLLTFAPDGHIMKMPVGMMHGIFSDFLIPGIMLTGLGILSAIAFFELVHKTKTGWLFSLFAMGGYMIWFAVEIIIVGTHWLQAIWGFPVVVGLFLVFPMIPKKLIKKFSFAI